jgi:hypothetical protein
MAIPPSPARCFVNQKLILRLARKLTASRLFALLWQRSLIVMMPGSARESETLASIRRLLLGALAIGVIGTIGELILLRHIDMATQWIPLVVLAVSVPILVWHARSPRVATVRTVQGLMFGFIAIGILGVGLHYNGNVDFERELNPSERGWTFIRKTVAGATPVLAPGSMVLLGLVGLAHAYRHPSADGGPSRQETTI